MGSMSQNMGVNPFRTIACVVDANVNGVVITSPCSMIQIILGVSIYLGGSKILKLDSFQYLWKIIKSMFVKRGSV